jgi:hypothetical protein
MEVTRMLYSAKCRGGPDCASITCCLSPAVAGRLVAAGVDREVRGRERSSDHAPIWIELADTGAGPAAGCSGLFPEQPAITCLDQPPHTATGLSGRNPLLMGHASVEVLSDVGLKVFGLCRQPRDASTAASLPRLG